ncbi:MAG: hypothetical protein PWP23_2603 [Candidatus Sumerlaeota bacterium]|nr:hypothetical protein [Candidatus Sumerlaeota bacterium]
MPDSIFAMLLAAVPVAIYLVLEIVPLRKNLVPFLVVIIAAIVGVASWLFGVSIEQASALFLAASSAPAVHGLVQASGNMIRAQQPGEDGDGGE